MPNRYKTKPIPVEARLFDEAAADNWKEFENWSGGDVKGIRLPPKDRELHYFDANDNEQSASVGMWIVKMPRGDCISLSDSMFKQTFEKVDNG